MSIISTIKEGLEATEQLTAMPFQFTRETFGDNSSLTGRFINQFNQIAQTAATAPIQIAKKMLDDPREEHSSPRENKKEHFNDWVDEASEQFEQLGRS